MKARSETLDAGMALARRWVAGLTGLSLQPPAIEIECRRQGWGILQTGRGLEARILKLGGQEYRQGLGSHADSELVLRSVGAMRRLQAIVGVDENPVTQTPGGEKVRIVFSVEVSGQELWRSREMNVKSGAWSGDVPLPAGTREIVLKAVATERAVQGTHWTAVHPEWFLSSPGGATNLLLNLGDPAARKGVTDFIVHLIRENRIGLYRQDFNFDPLPYWRQNDAEDRQGITEIKYVTGLYAFWDELLKKIPGLIIDNCASSGRRIDLETISRSIPLWHSDWQCRQDNDPVGGQTHGMGLSYWVPPTRHRHLQQHAPTQKQVHIPRPQRNGSGVATERVSLREHSD